MSLRSKEQLSNHCDQDVCNLATMAGIAVNWVDANNQPQTVSPASLRAILMALGLPCDTPRQTDESRARLQQTNGAADLPPLITAEVGKTILLPSQRGLLGQSCQITLESGEKIMRTIFDAGSGGAAIPAIDRYGYHRLQVATLAIELTLAVAPPRCYGVTDAFRAQEKVDRYGWGLALQLYGLRSENDGGIGNFGGLAQLAAKAGEKGATALAISPVHAMFAADAHRFSPYSPSSRLFLNVLHIDPADILGRAAMLQVLQEAGPEFMASHLHWEQAPQVHWPQAGQHRMYLLRRLYAMFRMQESPSAELAAFRLQGGQALLDHALFEALHQSLATKTPDIPSDWRRWPADYHRPDSAAMQSFARDHGAEIDFHIFLQWQAARGLQRAQQAARDAGMAVGLIADLAVGADNGGSQSWSHSKEMIYGLSVGAPPDLLNTRGQNWGVGAFSPLAMRAEGFRSYIAMLRAVLAHAGGVRIDHVMGLTRLWLTPEGARPTDGAYLHYPVRDLLRLVALESWRSCAVVIGEDLGTVPAGFGSELKESGLLGMGVLWFERKKKRFLPPKAWPAHAIATTSSHDLPTVAGWWRGRDIDWRTQLDLLKPDDTEVLVQDERGEDRRMLWQALLEAGCASGEQPAADQPQAVIDGAAAYIAQTPAPLALLPLEDLLGLEEQPNLPGTIAGHPNWQRRLPATASALLEQPQCRRRMHLLKRVDRDDKDT